MGSPFQRQRKQILENKDKPAHLLIDSPSADSLHIKLIEFEEDRQYLRSQFNSIGARIEHKRDVLIPKYKPLVESYLQSGDVFENPIFTNLVVWSFDIKDIGLAIEWCLKAIELDLPTPDNFRRDWPTFCADEVLDWAETQSGRGNSVEPYFSQIFEKVEKQWELHEAVHAKWFKFAGLHLIRNAEGNPQATAIGDIAVLEKALLLLKHADDKNSKVGVGTQIKKIEQRIRALKDNKNL